MAGSNINWYADWESTKEEREEAIQESRIERQIQIDKSEDLVIIKSVRRPYKMAEPSKCPEIVQLSIFDFINEDKNKVASGTETSANLQKAVGSDNLDYDDYDREMF